MKPKIKLSCSNCSKVFERTIGQNNASIKRGDKHCFCSITCAGLFDHQQTSYSDLICKNCNSKFVKRTKDVDKQKKKFQNPNFFCSLSCSAKFNNQQKPKKKRTKKCPDCLALIKKSSSYCVSCKNNHKDCDLSKTIQYYVDKAKNNNLGSKYRWIRDHAKSLTRSWKKQCTNCKYNKHVETCHIKSISSFPKISTLAEVNEISNLILLCPNCHWELDHKLLTIKDIKNSEYTI